MSAIQVRVSHNGCLSVTTERCQTTVNVRRRYRSVADASSWDVAGHHTCRSMDDGVLYTPDHSDRRCRVQLSEYV